MLGEKVDSCGLEIAVMAMGADPQRQRAGEHRIFDIYIYTNIYIYQYIYTNIYIYIIYIGYSIVINRYDRGMNLKSVASLISADTNVDHGNSR